MDPDPLAALRAPLRLRGTTLPNRTMMSALTLQYGRDGLITDRHAAFYRERADGGVGLLLSEQLSATPISDGPFSSPIAAYDPRQAAGYEQVLAALDGRPTRFFAQLFAGGAAGASQVGIDRWRALRAPSTIGVPGGETPSPLTPDEIEAIADDFARSAGIAADAGVHGIELHGAHGWLIGQFLSPFYNRREDVYGGDVEGRCRVARLIGRAVRERIGDELPLGISLTYDELIGDAGITPEDTLAQLEVLAETGIFDFFDLSIGASHSTWHTIASMAVDEGYPLPFAARAKATVGDRAAILVSGRILDPAMAASAVAGGRADVVALSRAQIADPRLLTPGDDGGRVRTRCVGANVCVGRALGGHPVSCVVNPVAGREREWGGPVPVAAEPRTIAIVGGGPAGLRVAATAARRGHVVTLYERDATVGGHLRGLAQLPTRGPWQWAIDDLVVAIEQQGGALRLGRDVTVDELDRLGADALVLATGSSWATDGDRFGRPDRDAIPGVERIVRLGLDQAIDRVAADPGRLGTRVMILDESGGYASLGLAERLAGHGVDVELVTPGPQVGAEAGTLLELPPWIDRISGRGVALRSRTDVEQVEAGGRVVLRDAVSGALERRDGVSSLVLALRRVPNDSLLRAAEARGIPVHAVGDVVSPRPTDAVIHEAEALARSL
jgi:2,4-dienoyl-CoA reductase-like NADH-dependent reductase (Old Yellow Enzyme family)